jgi:hypothetical protein
MKHPLLPQPPGRHASGAPSVLKSPPPRRSLNPHGPVGSLWPTAVGLPVIVGRTLASYRLLVSAIGAWFAIVFTGRNSAGSQRSLVQGVSYIAHADAYLICLTETRPLQCEDSIPALGSSAAA